MEFAKYKRLVGDEVIGLGNDLKRIRFQLTLHPEYDDASGFLEPHFNGMRSRVKRMERLLLCLYCVADGVDRLSGCNEEGYCELFHMGELLEGARLAGLLDDGRGESEWVLR